MQIAVIGTGIAGMTAAYRLCRAHDITVYEANDYIGGHTNTVAVPTANGPLHIDTGFIVYNEHTYPGFCRLLDELSVTTQPSEMSFSVRDDDANLEYCGSTLGSLFAQRRNLLRPRFYRMIADILDFNKRALTFLDGDDERMTLGEFLYQGGWEAAFVDQYIIPMGAAIWSMQPRDMFEFPARFFLRFFRNHGLLQVRDRPQWRTIRGGSARYAEKLTAPFRDRIRLQAPVQRVRRLGNSVQVQSNGDTSIYDAVVIATHSDQALAMIEKPSTNEREILSAMPYQANEAVLHTDTRLLPVRQRAWASWNYHLHREQPELATLTYNMNILQRLQTDQTYCVTLNRTDAIDPRQVLATFNYDHPVYSTDSVAAQRRYDEINGRDRIYYCGAYWRYGFHEDGLQSAERACGQLTRDIADGKLHLRRVG
ncbi:MAG: NAD(P)-binding protein [Gammaproteobacteria bacterium]|nr:NAD(P)-binding protein [Gammaproteobacteria bacterium]